jgi:uncharacterized iron-regulated membrane protein
MFRIARDLLVLLVASLVLASPGWARGQPPAPPVAGAETDRVLAGRPLPSNDALSLNEAIARARSRFPGRVVKADTVSRGGRKEHVVRIINDQGRVRTFRIDAQTGEFR